MYRTKEMLKVLVPCLVLLVGFAGCGQSQEAGELTPSEETSSVSSTTPLASSNVTVVSASTPIATSSASSGLTAFTSLPQDPVQRTRTIQLALKQAGYYGGNVDGKTGPLTQKAIEDFQSSKGLKVDGRVGSITWGELEKYLPETE